MSSAELITPAGVVQVVDVHAVAPLNRPNALHWCAQMAQLSRLRPAPREQLILAGDFNATLDHAPLQRLVASGLRDAFVESGRGFGATWPRWSGPVPSLMRLDHVLVSDQMRVKSVREQVSVGSDHRRLVVQLAIPVAG